LIGEREQRCQPLFALEAYLIFILALFMESQIRRYHCGRIWYDAPT